MFGRRKAPTTTPATTAAAETRRLWDELRAGAISDRDREEIDAVFSRQMP